MICAQQNSCGFSSLVLLFTRDKDHLTAMKGIDPRECGLHEVRERIYAKAIAANLPKPDRFQKGLEGPVTEDNKMTVHGCFQFRIVL